MRLYHAGYLEIREPDIHYGRKNADFGQGFYLTRHEEFAQKWARERPGETPLVNVYDLDTAGLALRRLERDGEWFDCLSANRAMKKDALAAWDVVIGPIANDTLFDTCGILTSGLLSREESLALLRVGPVYEQVVIKTEKARSQLRFLFSYAPSKADLAAWKEQTAREEAAYQAQIARALEAFDA